MNDNNSPSHLDVSYQQCFLYSIHLRRCAIQEWLGPRFDGRPIGLPSSFCGCSVVVCCFRRAIDRSTTHGLAGKGSNSRSTLLATAAVRACRRPALVELLFERSKEFVLRSLSEEGHGRSAPARSGQAASVGSGIQRVRSKGVQFGAAAAVKVPAAGLALVREPPEGTEFVLGGYSSLGVCHSIAHGRERQDPGGFRVNVPRALVQSIVVCVSEHVLNGNSAGGGRIIAFEQIGQLRNRDPALNVLWRVRVFVQQSTS
mmetsp:Transcript_10480/g.22076  ORF Transcript_10480/g.22076 Transcript_10480/m.22076 type:complete len:258 (+) Transcript_10480:431-1204(+)